ncbi:hypothetical protein L1887_36129 [Cichorium endivia]|nr:hypothetical protein L1887_36129 [Cichorium endivia]
MDIRPFTSLLNFSMNPCSCHYIMNMLSSRDEITARQLQSLEPFLAMIPANRPEWMPPKQYYGYASLQLETTPTMATIAQASATATQVPIIGIPCPALAVTGIPPLSVTPLPKLAPSSEPTPSLILAVYDNVIHKRILKLNGSDRIFFKSDDDDEDFVNLDLSFVRGGVAIEELARRRDAQSVKFSVPMKQHKDCNYSYVGLKIQLRLAIESKNMKGSLNSSIQ